LFAQQYVFLNQLFVFLSQIQVVGNVVFESVDSASEKIGRAKKFVVVVIVRLYGKRNGNREQYGKQQEIFIPNEEKYNLLHCFLGLKYAVFCCGQRHKWAIILIGFFQRKWVLPKII